MYTEESPVVTALAWFLAGIIFFMFIIIKLGALEAKTLPDNFSMEMNIHNMHIYDDETQVTEK